jgi:hypothetical protein
MQGKYKLVFLKLCCRFKIVHVMYVFIITTCITANLYTTWKYNATNFVRLLTCFGVTSHGVVWYFNNMFFNKFLTNKACVFLSVLCLSWGWCDVTLKYVGSLIKFVALYFNIVYVLAVICVVILQIILRGQTSWWCFVWSCEQNSLARDSLH